ncbi:hypothetical protein BV25DRAFT_1104052 [Artomyces pyxidatus]|uniref:Uncharacterized protein n=1 Tax=Artomyces pyxidatus TaxID=48021 RepID=A0ACB8TGE1_9AGAM|nr:hypothetical protein BV25DRAFT_1104052 [Artomyces pyxidatus]
MTLCELKTAQGRSIPMECEPFSTGPDSVHPMHLPYASCVEAISRSAQFWASYSGYLREIPQLCFAFQRGNSRDAAHELYQNVTLEKIAFIRYLVGRAKVDEDDRVQWKSLLAETRDLIGTLATWSAVVDGVSSVVGRKTQEELQKAFSAFQHKVSESHRRQDVDYSDILTKHTHALSFLLNTLDSSLTEQISAQFGRLNEHIDQLLSITDNMVRRWSHIEESLRTSAETVLLLSSDSERLRESLNSSAHLTRDIQSSQSSAARSTAQLAETLKMMTLTAHDALAELNETASTMKLSLGSVSQFYGVNFLSWPISWAFKSFTSLTVGRYGALVCLNVTWFVLRSLLSAPMMTVMFIVVPSVRWMLWRPFGRRTSSGSESLCLRNGSDGPSHTASCLPISSRNIRSTNYPWRRVSRVSRIPERLCRRFDE